MLVHFFSHPISKPKTYTVETLPSGTTIANRRAHDTDSQLTAKKFHKYTTKELAGIEIR